MADVKITELPSYGTLTDDDLLVIEQSNGTKKLPLGDVIPNGGTTGQYLKKKTNSDYDLEWGDISASGVIDLVYPVGSIYMSVSSTSPATLFGGTWEQLKDRFLLGVGDTYSNGATGGEATHTLTVEEMPSHTHRLKKNSSIGTARQSGGDWLTDNYGNTWVSSAIENTGGGKAHNNMPPYLVVYMWKRTA